MELAAVVVVPSKDGLMAAEDFQSHAPETFEDSGAFCSSRVPILGNDVMRSWMERVRKLGVQNLWLTSGSDEKSLGSELSRLARQGIDRLLVIKLKSYAEMDLSDLFRFHCNSRNSITEARDARGHLGISLLDRLALRAAERKYESSEVRFAGGRPYHFNGYAKRILSAKERQELVGDALIGACALRPSGKQIREQVWIGEGASLADSVRVIGPTYIGARTIVRAGATIGPLASVERDCVVDCGTTVEQSTVLPDTYLAPGLMIRRAMVDGAHLEDLRSGIVADLQPAGLGSRIEPAKSRKAESREALQDVFPRMDGTQDWGFAASSTASQPWIQVRL
ncbi:MAG TPA: hypothetical protein VGM18_14125 [Candidatus Sulfotelmatobacter sp.]